MAKASKSVSPIARRTNADKRKPRSAVAILQRDGTSIICCVSPSQARRAGRDSSKRRRRVLSAGQLEDRHLADQHPRQRRTRRLRATARCKALVVYGTLPSRDPHSRSTLSERTSERNPDDKFAPREQQRSSFMKLAIAGLLLAIGAGNAIAQTTSPGTSTAPDSAATGTAPGTAAPAERPRTQGNVPATTPGGPTASESSGPDPSKPRTSTSPDKADPSPK
jgi:hypothetical protein